MARPRSPQPPAQEPQPPPAALPPGQVADRMGIAAGAAATVAAATPIVAGTAVGVVGAAAVAEATKTILEAFAKFARARNRDDVIWLRNALREGYPQRTVREIAVLVSKEMEREREFQAKALQRLEHDLPRALEIPDRAKRAEAVDRILRRERRYVQKRQEAMLARSSADAERIDVKRASPLGAFWMLEPTVKQHTLDCLLMANKFWPWEVLDHYHPPLHFGCPCHLLTHREAVERGFIDANYKPDVRDALAMAKSIKERVARVEEAATQEEIEDYLVEVLEEASSPASAQACKYGPPRHDATKSLIWAEGRAYIPVCDQHEAKARARVKEQHDEVVRVVDINALQEASWNKRWPTGDPRGGQFRPRRGGGIRSNIRRTLKALEKTSTVPQLQERGGKQGRHVWLRGRYVFVPRGREFRRKLDGVEFHSPQGSTNIYRNGNLVQIEGQAPPPHHHDLNAPAVPSIRNVPADTPKYDPGVKGGSEWPWMANLTPEQADAALLAMQHGEHELQKINERLDLAMETMPDESPIHVGDTAGGVLDLLPMHGFVSSQTQSWENGDHVRKFKHLQSGAYLSVLWNDRTAKVKDVTWLPGRKDWAKPQPPDDHPPASWDEFADEVRGVAYRLAYENNATPVVGQVKYRSDLGDHSGFHHSTDGLIELGAEVPAVIRLHELRQEGRTPSPAQLRSAYKGYKVGIHEAIHGAGNVISPAMYATPEGKTLEEAVTEELAHIETVNLLRAHGASDVLDWVRKHPTDYGVTGTYMGARHVLDMVLNEAKVAPELREDYIRRLKWDVHPGDRLTRLGETLMEGQPGRFSNREEARDHAVALLDEAKNGATNFVPILRPSLTDFSPPLGVDWHGHRITHGTVVHIMVGGEARPGIVRKASQSNVDGFAFKLDVELAEGQMLHNVLDTQVLRVPSLMSQDNANLNAVTVNDAMLVGNQWVGKGTKVKITGGPHMGEQGTVDYISKTPGESALMITVKEQPKLNVVIADRDRHHVQVVGAAASPPQNLTVGSLIHYDGRADNGISEARVTNIVDLGVPDHADPNAPRFAIEAVTTENSLKPGTLVYLTEPRMNGVTVVPEERGRAPVAELPISTPPTQPIAVAADQPYVDPNTIPIQTGAGPLTFFEHSGDAIGPEYHQNVIAKNADGVNVGYVSVAFLGDEAAIKMIEVHPDYRRKGVASALIENIRRQKPGVQIETLGNVETPEGAAFIASGRRSSNVTYGKGDPGAPSLRDLVPETGRIRVRAVNKGRMMGGYFEADLEINGVIVGRIERGQTTGFGSTLYKARIRGNTTVLNEGRRLDEMLRELGSDEFRPDLRDMLANADATGDPGTPIWQQSHDEYVGVFEAQRPDETQDQAWVRYERQRELKRVWEGEIRNAMARGQLTLDQAQAQGFQPSGHERRDEYTGGGWQALPPVLYHATTAAREVRASGLKSRDELGQGRGMGLGGGDANTISFTTDRQLANEIRDAILEMRSVARGELTIPEMIDRARTGDRGSRPFLDWFTDSAARVEGKNSVRLLAERRRLANGIGEVPLGGFKNEEEMRAHLGPSARAERTYEMAPGNTRILEASVRIANDEDYRYRVAQLFKVWLMAREQHGGPANPLFFTSDIEGLRNIDPADVQVLQVRPRPGAQGFPLGGMMEWRTTTGDAVEVVLDDRKGDPGDYRGSHTAPEHEPGMSLDDPTNAFGGDDIYGPNAKHYYGSGGGDPALEKADWESLAVIQAARGKPDKMVTVYRAVPVVQTNAEKADDLEAGKRHVLAKGTVPPAKFGGWGDDSNKWYEWASEEIDRLRAEPEPELPDTSKINPGDWVTLSRSYAKQHGISNLGGHENPRAFKILSRKVRAGELFTDGDIWEWGWSPEDTGRKGDPGTSPVRGPFYIGTSGPLEARPSWGTPSRALAELNAGPRGRVTEFDVSPSARWARDEEVLRFHSLDSIGFDQAAVADLRAKGIDVVWGSREGQIYVVNPDVIDTGRKGDPGSGRKFTVIYERGGRRAAATIVAANEDAAWERARRDARKVGSRVVEVRLASEDTGAKGDPGLPEPVHAPSEFLTLPKSGKLVKPATEALGAVDGLIRVPAMHGPIPVRATAGKNTRGGFLRSAAEDAPRPPEWTGPTARVSGFGKGRGILPAKRADQVQVGDELLFSGGYRMKVTEVGTETKEIGFGRPAQTKVALTMDRGEEWGDSRLTPATYKPEEMLAFNWQPPADEMPPPPDMAPKEIRISVQEGEQVWATEATVVHELAHYMDNQAFDSAFARETGHRAFATDHAGFRSLTAEQRAETVGKARERGGVIEQLYSHYDSTDSPLSEWYDAVMATPEADALTSANMMDYGTHKYLLAPRELFARSFAQWVAMRSDNQALKTWLHEAQNVPDKTTAYRKQFDREQRKNVNVPYETDTPSHLKLRQWQDETFAPVAAALDRAFERLGWRSDGGSARGRNTDLGGGRGDVGARPGAGGAVDLAPLERGHALAADTGRKGDPGRVDRVPLDQVVYIAEGAMDRGGLDGGVVTTTIGHPHHPSEEGRAESARLTAMAREITGDPNVVVHVSNDPEWGGGANVIAAYDWVFNKVSIRPGASKLSFLHELAHVKTRTPEGPGGHTPEFVRALRDLYSEHISPEAGQQFWNIAGVGLDERPAEGRAQWWPHPIPVDPPKLKLIGPGTYDSEDGRITMYRIEGVRPYAWNVEWTTAYESAVLANGQDHDYGSPLYTNIVDGAASKKDAMAMFQADWPQTRAAIVAFESLRESAQDPSEMTPPGGQDGAVGGLDDDNPGPVQLLLRELAVPPAEQARVVVNLLLLEPEERVGFVEGWLIEANARHGLATVLQRGRRHQARPEQAAGSLDWVEGQHPRGGRGRFTISNASDEPAPPDRPMTNLEKRLSRMASWAAGKPVRVIVEDSPGYGGVAFVGGNQIWINKQAAADAAKGGGAGLSVLLHEVTHLRGIDHGDISDVAAYCVPHVLALKQIKPTLRKFWPKLTARQRQRRYDDAREFTNSATICKIP